MTTYPGVAGTRYLLDAAINAAGDDLDQPMRDALEALARAGATEQPVGWGRYWPQLHTALGDQARGALHTLHMAGWVHMYDPLVVTVPLHHLHAAKTAAG